MVVTPPVEVAPPVLVVPPRLVVPPVVVRPPVAEVVPSLAPPDEQAAITENAASIELTKEEGCFMYFSSLIADNLWHAGFNVSQPRLGPEQIKVEHRGFAVEAGGVPALGEQPAGQASIEQIEQMNG